MSLDGSAADATVANPATQLNLTDDAGETDSTSFVHDFR
jgi:hypothetical protein